MAIALRWPRPVSALIIFFCTVTVITIIYFNIYTPRLLILQSYRPDYAWTRDVNLGIRRVLGEQPAYAIRWFHMDSERHPWPQYRENIGRSARRLIEQWRPDVVLAVDDDAQEYVMKYYVDDPAIRIIFAGINRELTAYSYDRAANVTGILEHVDPQALKDALLNFTMARQNKTDAIFTPRLARSELINTRDRSKTFLNTDSTMMNEGCSLEWRCPKLFPYWQGILQDAMESPRDENQFLRAFYWSPLRLASSPGENFYIAGPDPRREISKRPIPNSPSVMASNTQEVNSAAPRSEIRFLSLGDSSEAARNDETLIRDFDWRPLRLLESRGVETFADWQTSVTGAAGRADFLIVTHYRALMRSSAEHTLVHPQEVVQWTVAHSQVPVIGTNGLFVPDGGYFAIGASPFEQGVVAASMALDILQRDALPQAIPIVSTQEFFVSMRGSKMQEVGLYLPSFYESFARATNNYSD